MEEVFADVPRGYAGVQMGENGQEKGAPVASAPAGAFGRTRRCAPTGVDKLAVIGRLCGGFSRGKQDLRGFSRYKQA